MKKSILALLLVTMTLIIGSCSKEDGNENNDNNQNNENTIVGRWKDVNQINEWYDGNGTLLNSLEEGSNGTTIEFATNGSIKIVEHGETIEGTYTLQDNILTISHAETLTYSVEQLTNSTMSLKRELRNQHYIIVDENNIAIGEGDDGVYIEKTELERLSK